VKAVHFKITGNCMWVSHQRCYYCDVSKEYHVQVFTWVSDWMELWFMEMGTIVLFVCNRWRKNASCEL